MTGRIIEDDQGEILDLVDENDEVIGRITRDDALNGEVRTVRIVSLFIQNDAGALLVPRRTAHKRVAPNGLDFSVSGYVQSGETYDEAMASELEEEAGLKLSEVEAQLLEVMSPFRHDIHGFMAVYLIRSNAVPVYNPQDFVSSEWLTPAELMKCMETGVPHKSDLKTVVRHCFPS